MTQSSASREVESPFHMLREVSEYETGSTVRSPELGRICVIKLCRMKVF